MYKGIAVVALLVILFYGCEQKKEAVEAPLDIQMVGNEIVGEPIPSTSMTEVATPSLAEVDNTAAVTPSVGDVPEKPTPQDIQQALTNAGLYQGSIDGKLGPKSKNAIQEFQAQNDLKADGKVGPKTWEKLKVYFNTSAPASSTTN